MGVLALFPENGLDRSLHAPVYIGLLFLVFFRETLGWGFAGLVVPGYLATVMIAAPVTGVLVIVEAILTYIAALALGRTLPRTGAWFTFFGRERFLLLIATASLIRLAIEGSLLPAIMARWDLIHSRELYSLGLVLVPLLANSFWNAGFVRAFPRVSLVTTLTYLIVSELLLPYTNFTLSRFQVANESVSLAFLESPHAHIILLVGAILGARNNVRYGWDYNGILVPALLAVAWYQPSKVATTLLEALSVYYVSMWLIRRRPFSRMMFVGCRRVVLTFSVGFAMKYSTGMLLARFWPEVQLIDFFGFGYLLPSLLANKMWDKGGVPKVLMPTLQVSILSFPIGTLLGYGLRAFEPPSAVASAAPMLETIESVPWALMLGDTAPAPDKSGTTLRLSDPYGVAKALARRSVDARIDAEALALAERGRLDLAQTVSRAWTLITPSATDPNVDVAAPRLAVRGSLRYGDDWLVSVEAPSVGSPAIPIAFLLAERIGARAIVLTSRHPNIGERDHRFSADLRSELDMSKVVRLRIDRHAPQPRLGATGELPGGVSTRMFDDLLGEAVQLEWQPAARGARETDVLELHVPRGVAERVAERIMGSAPLALWELGSAQDLSRRLTELSFSAPGEYRVPSIRELRMYGSLLAERFESGLEPSPWQRARAKRLGLEFAKLPAPFEAYALYEPEGPARRGKPTLVQRAAEPGAGSRLAVTLAAPRWEIGAVSSLVRLQDAFDADLMLVNGALVNAAPDLSSDPRRPQGRQSLFQRAHEAWLDSGGHSVILRGIPDPRGSTTDAVVTFDNEVNGLSDGPSWAAPLLGRLERAGVSLGALDGSAERAGFEASADPAVAYARRFAPDRSLVLWLAGNLRRGWGLVDADGAIQRRLAAAGIAAWPGTLEAFTDNLARCTAAADATCPRSDVSSSCDRKATFETLSAFVRTQNPYYLGAAIAPGAACGWLSLTSESTRTRWLALPPEVAAASPEDGAPRWLLVPLVTAADDGGARARGPRRVTAREFGELIPIATTPFEVAAQ